MAVGLPSSAAHRERDLGEVCASSTCVQGHNRLLCSLLFVYRRTVWRQTAVKYREPHHRASRTPACLFWIRVEPFDVTPEVTEE